MADILGRFADVMSANINSFLDNLEEKNAVKMIDQRMRKAREDLADVKERTSSVMATETAAKRKLDDCTKEVEAYRNAAANAVRAGNEDDARTLLASKQRLEAQLPGLQAAYDTAHENSAHLQAMFDKLTGDIEAMEAKADALKGRLAVAKAQEQTNKIVSGAGSAGSSASFDKLEDSINKRLDKANAAAELEKKAHASEDLLRQYGGGVAASSVDDELAKLKAELAGEG